MSLGQAVHSTGGYSQQYDSNHLLHTTGIPNGAADLFAKQEDRGSQQDRCDRCDNIRVQGNRRYSRWTWRTTHWVGNHKAGHDGSPKSGTCGSPSSLGCPPKPLCSKGSSGRAILYKGHTCTGSACSQLQGRCTCRARQQQSGQP